jgi:hypothetical protein
MMAGLDGIKNKIEPPSRSTRTSTSSRRRMAEIAQVPTSLGAVLDALEADHDFLTEGGVFTPDLIETWIDYKRANEIAPMPSARTRTSSSSTTTDAVRGPARPAHPDAARLRCGSAPWSCDPVPAVPDDHRLLPGQPDRPGRADRDDHLDRELVAVQVPVDRRLAVRRAGASRPPMVRLPPGRGANRMARYPGSSGLECPRPPGASSRPRRRARSG